MELDCVLHPPSLTARGKLDQKSARLLVALAHQPTCMRINCACAR